MTAANSGSGRCAGLQALRDSPAGLDAPSPGRSTCGFSTWEGSPVHCVRAGQRVRKTVACHAGQLRFARRFYLRLLLGAYLGLPGKSVQINRKNRGKPVLDATVHDEELHFSMAKSEDKLLIGFSTSSHIGVDLEPARAPARDAMGVARRYFTPAEADALAASLPLTGMRPFCASGPARRRWSKPQARASPTSLAGSRWMRIFPSCRGAGFRWRRCR